MPDWLPYVVVPALASLAGGALAAVRPVGERTRKAVQLFTGDIIVAAVAVERLPQLSEERPGVAAGAPRRRILSIAALLRRLARRSAAGAGVNAIVGTR